MILYVQWYTLNVFLLLVYVEVHTCHTLTFIHVYIYFWVLMVLHKFSFAVLAAQRQKVKDTK